MAETIATKLKPLVEISRAEDVAGLARGIAFRLTENFGVLKRESVSEEMKSLDQPGRAQLCKYGVRFGAFNVYFPLLLKPAAAELRLVLWLLKSAASHGLSLEQLPEPPRPGLTSLLVDKALPEPFYRACGYHACGTFHSKENSEHRVAGQGGYPTRYVGRRVRGAGRVAYPVYG